MSKVDIYIEKLYLIDSIKKIFNLALDTKESMLHSKFKEFENKVKEANPTLDVEKLVTDALDYGFKTNYSEDFKGWFNSVKKGFISSATFYPFMRALSYLQNTLKGNAAEINFDSGEILNISVIALLYILFKTGKYFWDKRKAKKDEINVKQKYKQKYKQRYKEKYKTEFEINQELLRQKFKQKYKEKYRERV